jgi:hypothetical protein
MKWLALILLLPLQAWADNSSLNLNIPSSRGTYQSDRIRAGDIDCSNAIGSATNVEFGVVGILNQNNPYDPMYGGTTVPGFSSDKFVRDIGVYGKITIPIGAPKERINCNDLYKLELEKKEIELQRLRQELVNLKNLQFEGDDTDG